MAASSSIASELHWWFSKRWGEDAPCARVVVAVGALTLVVILAADVRGIYRAAVRARLASLPVEPSAPVLHGEVLDLGIGKALFSQRIDDTRSVYRAGGVRVVRLRGSVAEARRKLLVVAVIHALAACAVLTCAAAVGYAPVGPVRHLQV